MLIHVDRDVPIYDYLLSSSFIMGMIPIAFLVIFILGAMVALGIGHKGWSYGTIAAAWLLLLASSAMCVLV